MQLSELSKAAQTMVQNLERSGHMKSMMLGRLREMARDPKRDADGSAKEVVAYFDAQASR